MTAPGYCKVVKCKKKLTKLNRSGYCDRCRRRRNDRAKHLEYRAATRFISRDLDENRLNDPARKARVARYAERAALGLPLFD